MIHERNKWLLRSPDTAYEGVHVDGLYGCKVCSVEERGTTRLHPTEFDTHLSNHRRESVAREPRRTDYLEECE